MILVGAGISIDPPSNIPAAAGLLDLLVDWICASAPELRPQLDLALAPPDQRLPYEGPYATTRFELLLEWIRYIEPAIYDALSVLDDCGTANLWHFHVAAALRRGAVVLTTNFDTRVEEACVALGVHPRVAVLSGSRRRVAELTDANLVKLHGSFPYPGRRFTPIGTLSQISRFGLGYERLRPLVGRLQELLRERSLVVAGYSGWDSYDVVPLLEAVFPGGDALYWHSWHPGGPLSVGPPRTFDSLTDLGPGHTAAGVLLSDLATASPGRVWEVAGPTPPFFRHLWPEDAAGEAHAALAQAAPTPEVNGLAALREVLFTPGFRLSRESAEALVGKLAYPYNSDDYKEPRSDAGQAVQPPPDERPEADPWEERVVALLDAGRAIAAADAFTDRIEESEAAAEEDNPLIYADVLIYGLSSAFWVALHNFRNRDAWRIARRIVREGRRRGALWAMVLGEYLEANVWTEWATARRGSPSVRHSREEYRVRAAARLDRAMRYALRIPRLDIFVDASRLRASIEPDPGQRARLERAVLAWAERLPPCEERLLAFFDNVRWTAGRGGDEQLHAAAERLIGEAATNWSRTAGLYRWAGECYRAIARHDAGELAMSIEGLTGELQQLPRAIDAGWTREIENFNFLLGTLVQRA
ncbi:MAG TPA: SIR2 family protein [Longimicrobiaceae bacterium]|nr:SIR2 family protein [Longimicrobiaceae bacterium]